MIVLLIAAAVVIGAPVAAAVLVTIASHYEDAGRSLAGRPPGPFSALARRLVCLRVGGTVYPSRPARRYRRVPTRRGPYSAHSTHDYSPLDHWTNEGSPSGAGETWSAGTGQTAPAPGRVLTRPRP